jgi:hypothetical protein
MSMLCAKHTLAGGWGPLWYPKGASIVYENAETIPTAKEREMQYASGVDRFHAHAIQRFIHVTFRSTRRESSTVPTSMASRMAPASCTATKKLVKEDEAPSAAKICVRTAAVPLAIVNVTYSSCPSFRLPERKQEVSLAVARICRWAGSGKANM